MAASGGGIDLGIPGVGPAELVGRGGFGLVYRAAQLSSGGVVAVKLLQNHLDETASTRFQREASALGSLRGHPNICTVYDAGVDPSGRPYLVMELAASSLAERIAADGPLPWPDAAALGVRLAGALETAHRARLLHRDVKPENVLLTSFGEWRLADFGLARLTDDTLSRDITATVTHAAPELLEGAPASVASDVYALGSTLFVALTGKAAFALGEGAHQASIFRRIADEPVPDMPGVPVDVAEVVRTAMAKAPTERFGSAADMGTALQEAQQRAGVTVTPLPLPLGETLPSGTEKQAVDTTVDARTPAKVGDLTTAVSRGGREAPPPDEPEPEPAPDARGRRPLLTALALIAVVGLIAAAMALRDAGSDDGDEGGGGTTSTGAAASDQIRLSDEWRQVQWEPEECVGADGGPCPDLSDFELYFSTHCPPVTVAGGFGRSAGQAEESGCEIDLLSLGPVPLEFDGEYGGAEVVGDDVGDGLIMESGSECPDSQIDHSIEFSVTKDEVRDGERVATELTGSLYVYYLTPPGVGQCDGTNYVLSFVMEAPPS